MNKKPAPDFCPMRVPNIVKPLKTNYEKEVVQMEGVEPLIG